MPIRTRLSHDPHLAAGMTVGHRLEDLEVPEHDEIITRGLAWATR